MITLVTHDPAWARAFEAEAEALRDSFGPLALRIDHVGSTAVAGLIAKPVIDIQVSVASLVSLDRFMPALASVGYTHRADPDPAFERVYPYFHRPMEWPHTHHVHLCEAGSDWERRHLAFRDALRADPSARDEYAALKRRLAATHGGATHEERQRYADAKTGFVARILSTAARN
jgi:GrpB-like predicted nucleotidyltransferase (UPF0157 family)